MVAVLAEAKTSAGAPETMLAARVSLPPKSKVTVVPGWAASNSLPNWVKVFLSEAAAKTVSLPVIAADAEALADPAAAAVAVEAVEEAVVVPEEEQAVSASSAAAAAAPRVAVRIRVLAMAGVPPG